MNTLSSWPSVCQNLQQRKSLKPLNCCDGGCIWGCFHFHIQTLLSHWITLLFKARCAKDGLQKASAGRAAGEQTVHSMASESRDRCGHKFSRKIPTGIPVVIMAILEGSITERLDCVVQSRLRLPVLLPTLSHGALRQTSMPS